MSGRTGQFGKRNGTRECSHCTFEKTSDLDLAALSPQLVSVIDFPNELEVIEGRVKKGAEGPDPRMVKLSIVGVSAS